MKKIIDADNIYIFKIITIFKENAMNNIFTKFQLDLFIQKHPRVIEFKRKAKELKKTTYKDLPLTKCQEIISQLHGFNNWHHFITLIKKSYSQSLDNIELSITKKPTLDYDHILIGHDINFNHYKWQNESSFRSHQLITGKDFYKDYEMFLIHQLIEKNKPIYVLNKTIDETYEIINASIKNKRENDLSIIDFSNNFEENKFSVKIRDDFSHMSSNSLGEFLFCLYDINNHNQNNNIALSLFNTISLILVYLQETKKEKINTLIIKKLLSLNELILLSEKSHFPEKIKSSLKSYLEIFDLFCEKTGLSRKDEFIDIHNKIYNDIVNKLNLLIENKIFDDSGIYIKNLFFNNPNKDINVFIFDNDEYKNKIYQLFIMHCLKSNIYNQFSDLSYFDKSLLNDFTFEKTHKYIFMRDIYLSKGFAVMPAQCRSLKISLFISYESVRSMLLKIGNEEEVLSVIGNTNTKFTNNDDDKDFFIKNSHLNNLKQSISSSTNLLGTYNLQKNKDYFWSLIKDKEYQLNFHFIFQRR